MNSSPAFQTCIDISLPYDPSTKSWRHRRSKFLSKTGRPLHFAQDTITRPESGTTLNAKFSYGIGSKDLEDEIAEVWLANCSAEFEKIGEAITDYDGRIAFDLQKSDVPTVGVYSVYYRIPADNTGVEGKLRVLPKGTRFVIFDIDETLSSDGTFTTIWHVATGRLDEQPRPGASETTRARYHQGYQIVYVTARPYIITGHTRKWLDAFSFAPGTLQLVQDTSETLVSDRGRANYKQRYLQSILDQGFQIDKAYGNAPSDISAYLGIGLSPESTYILGEHGRDRGTVNLGESFESHLEDIENESSIKQPFRLE